MKSSSLDSQSKPDLCVVPDNYNREVVDTTYLVPQSGLIKQTVESSHTSHENVRFADFNAAFTEDVEHNNDESFGMSVAPDDSFAEFFARPVKIYENDWPVGASFPDLAAWAPWDLWSTNPRVGNRLSNFKNFRGKLHLKVLINGNQFYYGRLLLAYLPFFHDFKAATDGPIPGSQMPHLWIDPSSSSGGEMVLPFFHQDNSVNITEAGAFVNMGTAAFHSVADLQHANGSTQPVSIHVYAWATDVVLSTPTAVNFAALVPQAGKVEAKSEYGEGPISKPAAVLASMAGRLKDVPVIGKYAMATQMGASAVSKIASMFGYSRPTVISEPCRNNPLPTGNMSNVDAPDTCHRFALTSKQEVTIDPSTTGLGNTDEMAFSYLAQKESYLTKFSWSNANPSEYPLFSIGVSPIAYNYFIDAGVPPADVYELTPMALVANPFRYWAGTIQYRFQVVASGYHKGRLLFVWDPETSTATPEQNVAYTQIVDIAEERDFTISVGWGSHQPALNCPEITAANYFVTGTGFNSTPTPPSPYTFNGSLTVYVLNELATPSATTLPIEILVSVSSPDLNVWAPHEERLAYFSYYRPTGLDLLAAKAKTTQLRPEAGEVNLSDENQPSQDAAYSPEHEEVLTTLGSAGFASMPDPIMVGEHTTSFRQCVKRYSQHAILINMAPDGVGNAVMHIHKQPAFPYYPGADTLGVDLSGATPVNRCSNTILNWITPAYSGWRGSLRWKIVPFGAPCCSWFMMAKRCGSDCNYEDNWVDVSYPGNVDPRPLALVMRAAYQFDMAGGWDGMVVASTQHNPVLEFEVPYYNRRRFVTPEEHQAIASSEGMGWWFYNGSISTDNQPDTDRWMFNTFVAAGEDFNLFFFCGIPKMYNYVY